MLGALWQLQQNYGKTTVLFYGFAENKETEINLDFPVEVNDVLVTAGQKVKEGQLLIEATQSNLGRKLNTLDQKISALEAKNKIRIEDTNAEIKRLNAQIAAKENEILSKIKQLQVQRNINRSLAKDLESIDVPNNKTIDPLAIKIKNLKKELKLATQPLVVQVDQLEKSLWSGNAPAKAQLNQLENERNYYTSEASKLSVTAPNDGVIGNVFCKEREYIDEFTTLISFYEKNPTMIKGFVHENLILEVNEGDVIEVISHQHSDHRATGAVVGMGSRIIEIPERLRKNPAFKQYGREVLIEISPDNQFLQKEKVVLKMVKRNESSNVFTFLSSKF